MAGLTPEEINKLVRETSKKISGGQAAITAADVKNILTIFEQFTANFADWTEDLAKDFVKETREILGIDKKANFLDELDDQLKSNRKKSKEEVAEMMITFYNKVVDDITDVFKDYGKKLYEDTIKPLATSVVNGFMSVKNFISAGFDNVKGFFRDGLIKFGSVFRKVLTADIKGMFFDAVSLLKSSLINILSIPLKILNGIFSTVVSMASMLFNLTKFAFQFIYNTLSFIANAALKISSFLLKVVLKVAYKILSTVATVALNVIGFVTKSVLAPLLFVAGTVGLILFAVWIIYGGLKKFFAGDPTGVFGSVGSFFGWIIDEFTTFIKNTFKIGGAFSEWMNEWWVNVWEGDLVSFDNPDGERSGGLKAALYSLVGDFIDVLHDWWYGPGSNKFGAGGISKQLMDWFLGKDGKSGFLGSVKDFLFGAGSATKSFFDLFSDFITDNQWFQSLMAGVEKVKKVINEIANSQWFKETISKASVIGGIATSDDLNAGEKLVGSAAVAFSSSGSIFGQMVQEAGDTTGPMRVKFNELNEYAKYIGSVMSAKYLQMLLAGDPEAKDVNKFIKNNFTIDSLSKYLPPRIVSGLKSNGQDAEFEEALRYQKGHVQLLHRFAFGDYKGDVGRNGLKQSVDDVLKNATIISADIIKKKGNPTSLIALENDYESLRKSISGLSDNVKMFAKGGIVTSPTRAIIGEGKSPEMVIPLNDSGVRFVQEAMEGITVENYVGSDGKTLSSVDSKLDAILALVKNANVPVQQHVSVPVAKPNNDAYVADMVARGMFEYVK